MLVVNMSSSENPSELHSLRDRPKTIREIYEKVISEDELKELNLLRIKETEEAEKAAVDAKNWKNEKKSPLGKEQMKFLRTGDNSKTAVENTKAQIAELSEGLSETEKTKKPVSRRKIGSK